MASSQIPSRWKRLLYSILSVVFIALVASFLASVGEFRGLPHFSLKLLFIQTFVISLFTLAACLPGWLLALPFVLTVVNFRRWRFWLFWAIGTALGPLGMLGLSLLIYLSSSHTAPSTLSARFFYPGGMAWFAVAIACPATLLYILLVRHNQRRARLRNPGDTA